MDSKAKRIPAAASAAYRTWPLPSVTAEHVVPAASDTTRPQPEPEAPAPAALTTAELEAIREAALAEGHREGLERGIQEGRARGMEQGIEQGREEGLSAAREEVEEIITRFSRLCDQLLHPIEVQREALQEALTALVQQLARTVIGRDPVTDGAQVAAAVEQALAALPAGAEGIELRLHSKDLQLLEQSGRLRSEWCLAADPALTPGDVLLHTRHSVVDFTREARFQQLLAALLEDQPVAEACSMAAGSQRKGVEP